jgi:hypothetical protein
MDRNAELDPHRGRCSYRESRTRLDATDILLELEVTTLRDAEQQLHDLERVLTAMLAQREIIRKTIKQIDVRLGL